ncbi:FMN dependent dehydrogenase, putative [Talaromyces stipitatus ATCC 10500]|uniref:FMN dependent dehydrogenase, putative n=1 Tax=Talaromyces stipitatus (strain ATCC 10500 / CBS 375.48 / QM 6759 / NRRL 1006) TaxID=441959 RepID=B8MH85_TALSN|nr:FMN dependent dehydrogenase, putative [Talaromyces stipitatus ATCC 10500]EED16899.1 FMN dependent dehydrogenase, putative [Talaromyces stipitatus ATCC 10500]
MELTLASARADIDLKMTPTINMANPTPFTYENEVFANGLENVKPAISFNPHDWESLAKDILPADSYGYIWGSAGLRETDDNNRAAFRKWALIPSRLVKSDFPSLKTALFGQEYDYPIAIAPIGVQRIFHRDGELASATAARKQHVPYIFSSAAATSIEDVARASGDGKRWYQLYWPSNENNEITASLLKRARDAGYSVLVVTLDTYILGWRPSDLNNGYNPFLRADKIGVELGFSDPVFRRKFRERHGVEIEEDMATAASEWAHTIFPGLSHGWEDLKFLQDHWDGPIVLKGIQSVADARRAVEAGVQGIVVSNHGGRQQDGGIGSLDVLPEIVDAVGDQIEVLFDSGVRGGADIAKALALGAKMVLIGRPYAYGLAIAGEAGVTHVLRCILADLNLTLHLSGIQSVAPEHLNRKVLRRVRD